MLLLEPLELVEHPVVLGIRDFRIVEDVVAMVVMFDEAAQLVDPLGDTVRGHA
jgi:hypothetical protein